MTQEEIIRTLAETESRSKSNTHRLDAVEKDQKAISQLASSVAVMANEQAHMRGDIATTATDVRAVKASVEALAEEPAQRWKSVVDKVLMVLVGALVSWVLAKLGIY